MNKQYYELKPISDPPKEDGEYILTDQKGLIESVVLKNRKWALTAYGLATEEEPNEGYTHWLFPVPAIGSRWIPVHEEMPEPYRHILAWCPTRKMCFQTTYRDDGFGWYWGGPFAGELREGVTHWAALPQLSESPSNRIAELEKEVESLKAQNDAVYEGASQWEEEYRDARSLLQQLWELKLVKTREGKTEAYQQRQPKVWEKVEQFLSKYQHL